MKKCPYCGTEADIILSDRNEIPSDVKCSAPTIHLIGGVTCLRKRLTCLRKRLTRSENRRQQMGEALCEFRCAVLDDTYLPDEIRDAVLERLDAAFSPIRGEANQLTGTNHDWLCDACGHWNGPNLAYCACCPRPGSDLS